MKVYKNSIAYRISREEAVGLGLVEQTPQEAEALAEASRANRERARASWVVYDAARDALAAIADPVARRMLDLHRSESIEAPKCEGCDMDGCEAEKPEWPCRTVQEIGEHFGIDMPDAWDLWRRPKAADDGGKP